MVVVHPRRSSNASVTSLVTLEDSPQKTSNASAISSVKNVHFDLERNLQHESPPCEVENQTSLLWYSHKDYKRFRREATSEAKLIRAQEARLPRQYSTVPRRSGRTSLLRHAGKQPDCVYECIVKEIERLCQTAASEDDRFSDIASEKDRQSLHWAVQSYPTGLDRWLIKNMDEERSVRRSLLIRTVRELQQHMASVDDLRIGSQCITRPGRLFATAMAHAQIHEVDHPHRLSDTASGSWMVLVEV